MQHLDTDYVQTLIARLERIPPDATPAWGELRKNTLIEHLIWLVKHSMGRSHRVPYMGNWLSTRVVAPIFLSGWVRFPKNLKLPAKYRRQGIEMREPGDIETLHALLEEYLELVQADEFQPALHPAFGDIGIDGWDRVHVMHFEHHCRQFGV